MGSTGQNATNDYDLSVLHWLFEDVNNVEALELFEDFLDLNHTEHVKESTNVVLVTNCLKTGKAEDIHFSSGDWSLVAVAGISTSEDNAHSLHGNVYSRHYGNDDGWCLRTHEHSVHARKAVRCLTDTENSLFSILEKVATGMFFFTLEELLRLMISI